MKIKLINISKHYSSSRKNKLSVLKKVTLNIYPGDIISVVGKNGSGKTTLLKVISKRILPDSGEVFYDDNYSKRNISFVSSNDRSFFWNMTVKANFDFFVKKLNKELVKELEISDLMDKRFSSLSSGEKKKLMISRSILSGNKVLILDEFTSTLDLATKIKIYELLKKLIKKKIVSSIIFSTHDINEVLFFGNKCISLNNGILSDEIAISEDTQEHKIKELMLK